MVIHQRINDKSSTVISICKDYKFWGIPFAIRKVPVDIFEGTSVTQYWFLCFGVEVERIRFETESGEEKT